MQAADATAFAPPWTEAGTDVLEPRHGWALSREREPGAVFARSNGDPFDRAPSADAVVEERDLRPQALPAPPLPTGVGLANRALTLLHACTLARLLRVYLPIHLPGSLPSLPI